MLRQITVLVLAAVLALWGTGSAFAAGRGGGNPPGWSKGEKKGWKGESEPPGYKNKGGKSQKAKKSDDDDDDKKEKKEKKAKKEKRGKKK